MFVLSAERICHVGLYSDGSAVDLHIANEWFDESLLYGPPCLTVAIMWLLRTATQV